MSAIAPILKALALPAETRVEQRVPKKLLLEHGAPTAADKRKIQEGIEELHWLASLKPIHCPTPAYQDEIREYLEIAVVSVTLRQQERGGQRLLTLIHRAIPYPLLLIAVCGSELSLSLAHKRFSQGETGKVVLDEGGILQVNVVEDHPMDQEFLSAMNTAGQPAKNLFVLYQGWVHRFEALLASRITSCFVLPATEEQA
ncbi:MAG: DUF4391 domain-containing protein, partial [Magnetococcales bacterium]|nr:DUF4391 domain-containing protein [Magnetococcales bacterium]